MAIALFLWLLATCFLSWDVAIGNALLSQETAAWGDLTQVQSQIADAENGGANAEQAQGGSGGQASAVATPPPGTSGSIENTKIPNIRYCERSDYLARVKGANSSKTFEQFENPTQRRLCDDLAQKSATHDEAIVNLKNWTRGWIWLHYITFPFHQCSTVDPTPCGDANNKQWSASLLSVLGGGVLPIFYGLLGAGAAVVRSLSAKMRESLLAPRDRPMSIIQLALGAVIGACIGLFVTPPGAGAAGAASTPGLLGAVHLSASALCFIAGFFVEGVFVALEGLMRRVFNVADPTQKPVSQ